jgi:hypothetical protein
MRGNSLVGLALAALALACGKDNKVTTFGISGTVSGLVKGAVTVNLSGASAASATTDAAGKYSFAGVANGSYTLTPSLAGGYVFTPASLSVAVNGADVTGQNFTDAGAYGISGTVSLATGGALSGASVALTGAATATTTTDSSGNYSFGSLADGTYTVVVSAAGYVFNPASLSVTVAGAAAGGKNFTATASASATHSVSGTVSGLVKAGVTLTLSGASSATTTSSSNGSYSFTGLADGSYTVTPSLAGGYVFTPASQSVTVSGANVTGKDFTDTGAWAISGTVSLATGGALAGVTMTLNGATTVTTDASGAYSFPGLPNGSDVVAPSLAGYVFSPTSLSVTLDGANATGKNFTATASTNPTYSISGSVSGLVKAGVTLTLSGANTGTTTTISDGSYSFTGLANGSYTITPSLAGGYVFTPASLDVTVSGANVTGKNFTDTGAYGISGTISGLVRAGVTLTLTGAATGTATSISEGSYAFTGLANGSYTITPSLAGGYVFTPTSLAVTVSGASVTGKDFSDTGAYSISGTVTESSAGLDGVTITLTGGSIGTPTTSTGASGDYSFAGIPNGSYTVTPSLAAHSFTPPSRSVAVSGGNQTGVDFTASAVIYHVSGTISLTAGGPLAGMTVRLSGASTDITTSAADGTYSFAGVADGQSYTVTPSMAGYTFAPASRSITISAADSTGNDFAGTASGPPVVTFTGTVSYGGLKTGRVFVIVRFPNLGNFAVGGTSLAAPGAFTIHNVQVPGPLPQPAVVAAWIDTLGIDRNNRGGDPVGSVTFTIAPGTTTQSVGFITLADAAPIAPPPPLLDGVIPADSSAAVGFTGGRTTLGIEVATSYKIYWSASPSPGPSNTLGTLSVPAGVNFGIVKPLTNATAYYFAVSALVGATESAPVATVSSTVIGPPVTGNAISGNVTFPDVAGAKTLYVVAVPVSSNFGGFIDRIPTPVSPQSYSIVVPDGGYQIITFLDLGDDGVVGPDEPGLFGTGDTSLPLVTVSGAPVSGEDRVIPSGNVVASLTTSHDFSGASESSSMLINVDSNLKIPVAVQLTSGPNILAPVDLPILSKSDMGITFRLHWAMNPVFPVPGDEYKLHVTYAAAVEDLTLPVTGFFTDAPTLVAPTGTGISLSPTFTWTAPSPAPAAAFSYDISVFGGGTAWFYGPMPDSQLSVGFSTVSGGASLVAATPYTWQIVAQDADGNTVSTQASFTTQ